MKLLQLQVDFFSRPLEFQQDNIQTVIDALMSKQKKPFSTIISVLTARCPYVVWVTFIKYIQFVFFANIVAYMCRKSASLCV